MSQLEHVGSLYIENQRLLVEYQKLLGVVTQLSAGDIRPDQVLVNESDMSWSLTLDGKDLKVTP